MSRPSRTTSRTLRGLGAKYGSTVRKRYSRVYGTLKQTRRCPSCGSTRFRRKSAGIWRCPTCNYSIASDAYDVTVPAA